VAHGLKRGWVPADEGFLGQTAERVLGGELPHRDYIEGYTGGLSYLNALAFRLFGINLASLRYMLALFFLAWVPAFYYTASRFVSLPVAGAVTLLAVAWSIPNYPAALPSWYNLFFATFGVASLLRYLEAQAARWLFLAGLCAGISFLFKISGLYFIAGVIFFLLFRERAEPGTKTVAHHETAAYRIFLSAAVLLYEAMVFALLRKGANPATFLYFWVPNLAIGVAILWLEFRRPENRSRRFSSVLRELIPFTAGTATPIAIFLAPFVLTGSLPQFWHDVFVMVAQQVKHAYYEPSVVKFFVGTLVSLVFIAAVFLAGPRVANIVGALFIPGIPIVLFLARKNHWVYRVVWSTIWSVIPIVIVVGAVLLVRWAMLGRANVTERQKIFLVLSVTAACNLIQFPWSIPIYFCYVAPLALLSVTAVASQLRQPPRWAMAGALCFCLCYVVWDITPGFINDMGEQYSPDQQVAKLTFPRADDLRVYASDARVFNSLVATIQAHSRNQYIYATPDCPEVYFFSGFRNPSPVLFDFGDNPTGRTQRILRTIQAHDINLVVLDQRPQFSEPVSADLRAALEQAFPNRATVDIFEVRWK
jgi:4-amino-4-deoxy-L-arabinose transferase-like glycosyltransferase